MARRWMLPFPIVSDPGGEEIIKPLGLFNPNERGGIGIPAILVIDRDGQVVYRYQGRDFTDRADDEDIVSALGSLALDPLDPPPKAWQPEAEPDEEPGAFRTEFLGTYMRAVMLATGALAMRLETESDRNEAAKLSAMAGSFLVAWHTRRKTAQG